MQIPSEKLIKDLMDRTQAMITAVEKLKDYDEDTLNRRMNSDSWSILECIEHLNLYGDFYLPEIENCIKSAKESSQKNFKSGILGNYFAKAMLPKEKLNKMKTFKDKNPIDSMLSTLALERFIQQQERLLLLLTAAKGINLNKTKTAISISKWIRLKLGDTFRVLVYHNERHILQAKNILVTG